MIFIVVTFCVAIMAGCVGYRLGRINGQSHEHMTAMIAGVGGWAYDPDDGEYRFRYGRRPPLHRLPDPPEPDDVEYAPWV
jgi:hypothetical protein